MVFGNALLGQAEACGYILKQKPRPTPKSSTKKKSHQQVVLLVARK
jgi:hypothetical protein